MGTRHPSTYHINLSEIILDDCISYKVNNDNGDSIIDKSLDSVQQGHVDAGPMETSTELDSSKGALVVGYWQDFRGPIP